MVAVTAALKDKVEERAGKEEEGGKQGAVERKETEGAGTSQVIQVRRLSQEKDDGDGLPDCANFFNNYLVFSIFFLRVCSPPRLRVEPLWVKLLFLRKGVLPYIY